MPHAAGLILDQRQLFVKITFDPSQFPNRIRFHKPIIPSRGALWENYAESLILFCKSLVFAQNRVAQATYIIQVAVIQHQQCLYYLISLYSTVLCHSVIFPRLWKKKNPYKGQFNPISAAHDVTLDIYVRETSSCFQSSSRIYHQRPPLFVTKALRFM